MGMLEQFSIDFINEFAPDQAELITMGEAREFIEKWTEKNTTQIN